MKVKHVIQAIDSHTAGEPTRVVVGGMPKILGNTMTEKKIWLEENLDYLRKAIMLEPRGHSDMFGSIIMQPVHRNADFGVISMDGGGYLNMCGHGTIGAMTVAVETGIVYAEEPVTEVILEAPAGLIRGKVVVKDGRAEKVSFTNIPSFLFRKDQTVDLPEFGEIRFDIAFGGSFFAIVHAGQIGVDIVPENASVLNRIGIELREIINREIPVQHPTLTHIRKVDLVEWWQETDSPSADLKNCVVFGHGQVDRSPCGTGTCAKLASLFARGQLGVGETFVYESILGMQFEGVIVGETKVGEYDAVIPQITGSAWITSFTNLVIDDSDPLKYGYRLR